MSTPARFYDSEQMTMIAELFSGLKDLFRKFEGEYGDNDSHPCYVWSTEIVIRHKDDYTVGRFAYEDDQLIFEITDENYGYADRADMITISINPPEDPAETARAIAAALDAHIRQEDTAAGQKR